MSYKVESCKEFVMRIVRCLIVLRAVMEFVRRIVRFLNELRAVSRLIGDI